MQGQVTCFSGPDLCIWSRKNRKSLNSMKPMTESTNLQRQIHKRSTQERSVRGNFPLLQLILNTCPGFYCNLLYKTEKRKHATSASPFSGFIYSPMVPPWETCSVLFYASTVMFFICDLLFCVTTLKRLWIAGILAEFIKYTMVQREYVLFSV